MLDRDTCLELLASEEIGRLAIGGVGAPALMPVNYALDGETVVFRTDPGTKLERAGRWAGPRSRSTGSTARLAAGGAWS